MAARIREPEYSTREFFEDCVAAFPELELFAPPRSSRCCITSSGRDSHIEYQRTFGALFAVYWLLRLDIDGRCGLAFGCDLYLTGGQRSWNISREQSEVVAKRCMSIGKLAFVAAPLDHAALLSLIHRLDPLERPVRSGPP